MKVVHEDIKNLVKSAALKPMSLGTAKGSTVIIYKRKAFFVWKDNDKLFLQGKWFWDKKYVFLISDFLNK